MECLWLWSEGKNGKKANPTLKEGGNAKFTQVTFHSIPLKRAQNQRTTLTILWEHQHRNGYKPTS